MITMKVETWFRLQELAAHPKGPGNVDKMMQLCGECNVHPDDYVVSLTLQLAVLDAFDAFAAEQTNRSQLSHMRVCAGVAANALCRMTQDKPLPGADVASMAANAVITFFALQLGKGFSFFETPPPVKTPTNSGNLTVN